MLSKILSKSQCAECGFCCVFKRASRWETPLFSKDAMENLSRKYPDSKFKPVGDMYTIDIDGEYKTDNENEEAPCFFLDNEKGCVLNESEKPLDCKIWPLRVMDDGMGIVIALTPTCREINKLPISSVIDLVDSGLGDVIKSESEKMSGMIKKYREDFPVLKKFY